MLSMNYIEIATSSFRKGALTQYPCRNFSEESKESKDGYQIPYRFHALGLEELNHIRQAECQLQAHELGFDIFLLPCNPHLIGDINLIKNLRNHFVGFIDSENGYCKCVSEGLIHCGSSRM